MTQDSKPRHRKPEVIHYDTLPDDALLRERELWPIVPFTSPTLWRRVKSGDFPQPIRLPGRMTCWRWGEVRAWLQAQGQPEKAA